MKYLIDKEKRPVYLQLYAQIRDDIINGVYPYGSKLMSKRNLAEEAGVSTVTVEHAYSLLCDEGYAEAKERSGFVVIFRQSDGFASTTKTAHAYRPAAQPSSDYPEFPITVLSKTMRKVLNDHGDMLLDKSPSLGCAELREAIRRYLVRNRGIEVSTDRIVIGAGSEYLYGHIIELLGRDHTFAIETPSYNKIEQVYKTSGVSYDLLPLTESGIDSAALAGTSADVLHTTPYRSYPSGITATASKLFEYVRWASQNDRYIIEDDFESEFYVSAKPKETLFAISPNDNVIYLNTFSKTISQSLRIGYMVLPSHLAKIYEQKLGFYSCAVPTFMQHIITELIDNGDFERHINRVRRTMRKKLQSQ